MSNITAESSHAEVREHWAQALESGEYAQATGRLADTDEEGEPVSYCCLGVACDLAIRAGVLDSFDPDHADLADSYRYRAVMRWIGLRDVSGKYASGSLAVDNDAGETFREIAATIRAEPENLFVD